MIDLGALREQPEKIIALLHTKDSSFDGQRLYQLDVEVRLVRTEVEELRCEKNMLADSAKKGITPEIRERSIALGKKIKEREESLASLEAEFNYLYLRCPNVPFEDLPRGGKEANAVVKEFGNKPVFTFAPRHHVEIGENLGWFNFDAAAKMTGSNFVLYQGQAVTLMYALTMFMLNNNMRHGYSPMLPPYLVNERALEGASNFPRFKEEVYSVTADGLYLTPTAEVNLTSVHQNHIFSVQDLPVRMTAWTSCFRREAGGYGATERGLIRIHQFEKLELYAICTPEESVQEQEKMLACAEDILQKLGLHYRISLLATGDCSFASAKTYDIEVWMPGQKEYKEVSSISNCGDFQARRSGIRYRKKSGEKTHLANTLNGSSLALPRVLVALMETYQQEDGSVAIPDVLRSVVVPI